MRMLMNNLDPEVAERPDELVVYGGRGKAARNWESYDAIIKSLQELEVDETLLVQSGKPIGIARTTEDSPRVIIANSNLVPHWGTQETFDDLEARDLMMYGQMTAGSWIYIGTQGILQGTYETFAECARQHFGGTLSGTLSVTGGCGGMGGAQPLAVTMNKGTCLIADVCIERLEKRVKDRYLDEIIEVEARVGADRPFACHLVGQVIGQLQTCMGADQVGVVDIAVIQVPLRLHLGLHRLDNLSFTQKLVVDLDAGDVLERLCQRFGFIAVCRDRFRQHVNLHSSKWLGSFDEPLHLRHLRIPRQCRRLEFLIDPFFCRGHVGMCLRPRRHKG